MIVRTWRGATRVDDAEAYLEYLRRTGFAEYGATPGNRGVLGLRRLGDARAEFFLITLWESPEAIHRFAGERPERAVFYPEDDDFLVERDDHVDHYEVVFRAGRDGMSGRPRRGLRGLLGRAVRWWYRGWVAHVSNVRGAGSSGTETGEEAWSYSRLARLR